MSLSIALFCWWDFISSYPERFAQEALGHNSKAVHRAYARKAQVLLPALEDYVREVCPEGIQQEVKMNNARKFEPEDRMRLAAVHIEMGDWVNMLTNAVNQHWQRKNQRKRAGATPLQDGESLLGGGLAKPTKDVAVAS